MRVTTWAEYGLIVSVHLARRAGAGPIAARELADRESLPADYVEQILLRLRRASVVTSVRGARGGYMLGKDADAITVKDVLDASEHGTFQINCDHYPVDPVRCAASSACSIRPVWRLLARRIDEVLGGITLAELVKPEKDVEAAIGLEAGSAVPA